MNVLPSKVKDPAAVTAPMSPLLQPDATVLWVVTLRAPEGAETLTGVALSKAATW